METLIRDEFGLTGKMASDGAHFFQHMDMILRTRSTGILALRSRADLYNVTWLTKNNLLDSFLVLLVSEAATERRMGALIRLRRETGVMISGWEGSGSGGEPKADRLRVDHVVVPSAAAMVVPQAKTRGLVQDFGADGWWIERYPAGADLPRK